MDWNYVPKKPRHWDSILPDGYSIVVEDADDGGQPNLGAWRTAWFNLSGVATQAIVSAATSKDKSAVLATLTDDPNTSGT